jgi:hypothetical protein
MDRRLLPSRRPIFSGGLGTAEENRGQGAGAGRDLPPHFAGSLIPTLPGKPSASAASGICSDPAWPRNRPGLWHGSRTALDTQDSKRHFRVTHPFHPWHGRRFEFVDCRQCWGGWRVFCYTPEGQLAYFPAAWTDAGPVDPFVVLSAGRAVVRVEDPLRLIELMEDLRAAGIMQSSALRSIATGTRSPRFRRGDACACQYTVAKGKHPLSLFCLRWAVDWHETGVRRPPASFPNHVRVASAKPGRWAAAACFLWHVAC